MVKGIIFLSSTLHGRSPSACGLPCASRANVGALRAAEAATGRGTGDESLNSTGGYGPCASRANVGALRAAGLASRRAAARRGGGDGPGDRGRAAPESARGGGSGEKEKRRRKAETTGENGNGEETLHKAWSRDVKYHGEPVTTDELRTFHRAEGGNDGRGRKRRGNDGGGGRPLSLSRRGGSSSSETTTRRRFRIFGSNSVAFTTASNSTASRVPYLSSRTKRQRAADGPPSQLQAML